MASAPKPPDPYKQGAAQQAAEMGAAQTSAIVNNPNIVNPYGTQTYSISGYEKVKNAKGKWVDVPRYTQTQTLSPAQQELMNLQNASMKNFGQLAVSQSNKLQGLLGQSVNTAGLSPWQSYSQGTPQATSYGSGGNITRNIAGAGPIERGFGQTKNKLQGSIAGGGTLRQDQGKTDRKAIEREMMKSYARAADPAARQEDAQLAARGMGFGTPQGSSAARDRGDVRAEASRQAYLASGAESRAAQDAYNQVQQTRFGQNTAQAQFRNQAQAQEYEQLAQRAGFANAAQMQQYTQNAGNAAFANQAQAQANAQNAALAAFANQGRQQNFLNRNSWADMMNNLRGSQMQERMQLRNQPLNEISALMSGAQVTLPQFQQFHAQGVNAAPIGQYIGQNYANQANAANSFNQGLFGLGGAMLGGIGQAGGMSNFFGNLWG